jgi:hypothetical protein
MTHFEIVKFENGKYGVKDTRIEGMQLVASGMALEAARKDADRRNWRVFSYEHLNTGNQ